MTTRVSRSLLLTGTCALVIIGALAALGARAFSTGGDDPQTVLARDLALGGAAREGAGPVTRTRVTPTHAELPRLPATETLEAEAAKVPADARESFAPGDRWIARQLSDAPVAAPVFMKDSGELVGIYVQGAGIVDRAVYDDPTTDLEIVRIERIGEEAYAEHLQLQADLNTCVTEEDLQLADCTTGG